MTTSRRDFSLPPGCTFCPTENELTDLYLHGKITGEALPDVATRSIHAADVYSTEPDKLVEGFDPKGDINKQPMWYFFAPVRYVGDRKTNAHGKPGRKARTIKDQVGKNWHSEKCEPVKGGSKYGGYREKFSYMVRNESTGKDERAGWIMTEFGISPEHGGGDLVLCEIHRSTRTGPKDDVILSKKRKAAGRHEDPRCARPRMLNFHPAAAAAAAQEPEWYGAASLTDQQNDAGDLAVPPYAPAAAQPEDDTAGLLQTVTADEVPRQNYDQDGQMDVSLAVQNDFVFDEKLLAEFEMNCPELFGANQVAEEPVRYDPAGFADQNMEQGFCSSYQNGVVMPAGNQAVLPCAPAAQPEEDDATRLLQTVIADEVPGQSYDNEGQMYASLGEEQPEPDKTAADEVIAFSPEMFRRCTDSMMMPWQSSSSMSTFGMY